MSVRAASQCSWGRPAMHLSDGTGRDWYILGDARFKNGRWTPPVKPFGRSSSSTEEPRKTMPSCRISSEKRLQTLSTSRNVRPMPPKAVIERWRHQADTANALSQTPSMDVDPAVRLPEAPVDTYSHFSDTRMVRRLAFRILHSAYRWATTTHTHRGYGSSVLRATPRSFTASRQTKLRLTLSRSSHHDIGLCIGWKRHGRHNM
ncbi:unnamed protein product [Cladocopium goreaui]|uniref:WW domain-containing protein n=1 Tax=Cladocopium goreaui TaxID=2562237 RepID=A0A9P1C5G2_9DINO|nr:unnamed protein product [Cladocopium goreaui]